MPASGPRRCRPAKYDHSLEMFRLVSGILGTFGVAHDLRSLKLHVVPGCRFAQHESLNHYVTLNGIRRFCLFCAKFLIRSAISTDLLGEFKTCLVKPEIRNAFPGFSSSECGTCGSPDMRKSIHSPGVASSLIEVRIFYSNKNLTCKSDYFVQCA